MFDWDVDCESRNFDLWLWFMFYIWVVLGKIKCMFINLFCDFLVLCNIFIDVL